MKKLRPLARSFISCSVISGNLASFWNDDWTRLGSLLDITGLNGPRVTGIAVDALVRDAVDWSSRRISHRRHPTLSLL